MPQNNRRSVRWALALLSARTEAYLSTHAFEILFLATYALSMILMFLWGAHDEFYHRLKSEQKGEEAFKWLIAPARGSGLTLNLNSALVVLLACRLLVTKIRETPLHRILPLDKGFPAAHIVVGFVIAVGTLIHVFFHVVLLLKFNKWDNFTWWSYSMTVITGLVLLVVFAVMFFTSLPKFRKTFFRSFHIIHMLGASLYIVVIIFHGVEHQSPMTYKYIAGPVAIYAVDRLIRHLKEKSLTLQISADQSAVIGDGRILKLRIPKPFDFRAGQYAELRVPSINKEWHPFTMASAPHEDDMMFYVKTAGNWTEALCAMIKEAHGSGEGIDIDVRGPFGAPGQHVGTFERVILISGGIGATPFASIAKHVHHHSSLKEKEISANKLQKRNTARALFSSRDEDINISQKIGQLYGIAVKEEDGTKAVHQVRAEQLTDLLNVAMDFGQGPFRLNSGTPEKRVSRMLISPTNIGAGGELGDSISLDFGVDSPDAFSSFSLDKSVSLDGEKPEREDIGWKFKAFLFLHTTRVSLALLFSVIIRISIGCIISIFNLEDLQFANSGTFLRSRWLLLLGSMLAIIFTLTMLATIVLEMSYMKSRFFRSITRCLDTFVLLPASIVSCILGVRAWAGFSLAGAFPFIHYIVFLPLIFVLLSVRMYRSTRSRNLLESGPDVRVARDRGLQDVDFLWTTPHSVDDQWLRDELCPLANGTDLRLHRYVTREKEVDAESAECFIDSHLGRPGWDAFFQGIAESSENRTEIGVFFCGPPGMGTEVKRSLRTVEILSNLRGAYLRATVDSEIVEDLHLKRNQDMGRIRDFGANVRFVFREENF